MNLVVESSDVVKLVEQFLKENNLVKSLNALQEESGVALNTVDDVNKMHSDIVHGRWDIVLETVQSLRVPAKKLVLLYEQVVLELAELGELETARSILRSCAPMDFLKREQPQRYLRLEHLLQKSYFDPREAYPHGSNKDKRRHEIAEAIRKEVTTVPSSRLTALVTQALKWQQHNGQLPKGARYDLFRGAAPQQREHEERVPKRNDRIVKFSDKSHAECAAFSLDGQFLVSGTVDGFVEVWDFDTGKLRKDLKYQAEEDFMVMEDEVLCLAFSRDSELIAAGGADGQIKVFRLFTAEVVRKFSAAHTAAVTSLAFSRDSTQILSSSADNTAKIHGLRSGRNLKEFRGHKSFVNCAIYSADFARIITGSADGTVKVWDAKTTDCLKTFRPHPNQALEVPVHSLVLFPSNPEQILVGNRSSTVYVMTMSGQLVRSYSSQRNTEVNFLTFTLSARGNFLFCAGSDHVLYCFDMDSGKLEHVLKLHEKTIVGLAHHPHRNILASFSVDSSMKLWRP
eukprot:432912_1